MDIDNSYTEILKTEINNLVLEKWDFLDNEWPKIYNKYNHRTEIKEFKNNSIRFIKNELLRLLGYIPVYYFLVVLFGNQEYPGPFKEVEKGLLILYHIVCGENGTEMEKFIPYATFYRIYKMFWITNYTKINKKVKADLCDLFSNIKIRILISSIVAIILVTQIFNTQYVKKKK